MRNLSARQIVAIIFIITSMISAYPHSNTIQQAIDSVAAIPGGGVVTIQPGITVTGSLSLKSNVTLHLEEGAILQGSINPYDYDGYIYPTTAEPMASDKCSAPLFALISAKDATNIKITGNGLIDGRGLELALAIDSLHHTGERIDPNYNMRRMRPSIRPKLIDFESSDSIQITDVELKSSSSWGISLNDCRHVYINGIHFENRAYWNNDGIDISDCKDVIIEGCYINSADDGIVLKSFNAENCNDRITIRDCHISSSASAVKMGTESFGGFKNIKISNIKIKDTYRSAIALESVDGAVLENIVIDSICASNTGNAFFVRLGHRRGEKPGIIRNVSISNLRCDIPFGRPDEDYDIRGPEINVIHNPFPASITGIPGHRVENISLSNIDVTYPGRGTKGMGYIGAYRYKDVPEQIDSYPEFHMFGELPAWGLFLRHVDGITFENVTFKKREPDYRPMVVAADDVINVTGKIQDASSN